MLPRTRPLPYWLWSRCADWWHATRDGHAGRPVVAEGVDSITAHVMVLGHLFDGRVHRVHVRVADAVDVLEVRRAELDSALTILLQARTDLGAELTATPTEPGDTQLRMRRLGERDADLVLVAHRRRREHAGRRASMIDDLRRIDAEIATLDRAIAGIDAAVAAWVEWGDIQIDRLHALMSRRIAAYERRLVRVHRHGAELGARLPIRRPVSPLDRALPEATHVP